MKNKKWLFLVPIIAVFTSIIGIVIKINRVIKGKKD